MPDYKMLDYIRESPKVLAATLKHNEAALVKFVKRARSKPIKRIILTGLGSSYTAAIMAKPIFNLNADLPVLVINAEEINYFAEQWIRPDSLVIATSRSGERQSVVNAIDLAKEKGAIDLAVTGVADSLLAQHATTSLLTKEGTEITFPKTKSVATCAGILMRLALAFAEEWNIGLDTKQNVRLLNSLPEIIDRINKTCMEFIKDNLKWITQHSMLNVVGTCSNYGVALEAAIKVQEAAYVPTRGNSTAGLLQGPIGALNKDWLVVALVMQSDLALSQELVELVHGFGAHSICVCEESTPSISHCDKELRLSTVNNPFLSALGYLPFIQLLTYYWAVEKGLNPDAPSSMNRILNKIVPKGRKEPEFR